MCGIIGFTGYLDAAEVLLEGLSALEYRGYDSAGIACCVNHQIVTVRTAGKVARLQEKAAGRIHSSCGIGHTRWATHGGVSEENAHPHSCGRVTLIHNGIIENYHILAEELAKLGRRPISQTDSEIAAMLMDSLYEEDPKEAVCQAVSRLEGSYAFCILFSDRPGIIYCIRRGSPLVLCHTEEGSVAASDMVALLRYSRDYFVLPENQIAVLNADGIEMTAPDGTSVHPQILSVTWDLSSARKNGFKHYMLKEIHEQPDALRRTVAPRLLKISVTNEAGRPDAYLPDLTADGIPDLIFSRMNRVVIAACGTAMHAGLIGRILLERLLRIPVSVEIASEFRYQDPILDEQTLVITVSQSGETADTIAALRLSRERRAVTLSVVNVKGSSIARESDYALACEGSIKLKEITYIHSEAYAAGELKHGTLSLITEGVPVIALGTQLNVLSKLISNIKEVRARGAMVILITKQEAIIEECLYDDRIDLPDWPDLFAPFGAAVILQLLAYNTSACRGLDVDQPRNLAKSVTVE